MFFTQEGNAVIGKKGNETLRVEAWGTDALRVRSTVYPQFTGRARALTEKVTPGKVDIAIDSEKGTAEITNGKIKCTINEVGVITFYKDGKKILREYYRSYGGSLSKECICLKIIARDYKPYTAGDYKFTYTLESNDGEKIYGMGQYQQDYLDLKGCTLELAQRNSQTSIPFALSSLGYGFFWNNPAVGRATFGKNYTTWVAEDTKEMDYWITAGDTPKDIIANFTEAVGRPAIMRSDVLGFWQCKLRYRTQEEVLTVARKYKEMGIPLDVIVIDFFHWPRQGDWRFDEKYWPDPKAMVDELHAMGTRVVVSVWPSVDRKSENFYEMYEKGLLMRTERGTIETYDFQGDCVEIDLTNPEARKYIWEKCKKNYYDYGIDIFWLDNAEPDLAVYDYDNYRYYEGPALEVSNLYPMYYAQAFYDGQVAEGNDKVLSLLRCGWEGSQKYGALLWSGDVQSTYESFKDQLSAGLNIGLAGISWWTTDIGGFMNGDVNDPKFIELLERWFEMGVFLPIMRLHGDRDPHNIPALVDDPNIDYGGGYLYTGQPNEIWSYGKECEEIMKKAIELRISLKPYLEKIYKEAHENGSPLMRTMFYEFPEDAKCWELEDQYMFGPDYLVAPIFSAETFEREVYLPAGTWTDIRDGKQYEGGKTIVAPAPIDSIPVFKRN